MKGVGKTSADGDSKVESYEGDEEITPQRCLKMNCRN
jgi:hypothetical protein